MSFWTATHGIGNKEPKRAFRFKIIFNGLADDSGYVWFAKKVAKPKFEISESEHTFLTHKFYYPGRVMAHTKLCQKAKVPLLVAASRLNNWTPLVLQLKDGP